MSKRKKDETLITEILNELKKITSMLNKLVNKNKKTTITAIFLALISILFFTFFAPIFNNTISHFINNYIDKKNHDITISDLSYNYRFYAENENKAIFEIVTVFESNSFYLGYNQSGYLSFFLENLYDKDVIIKNINFNILDYQKLSVLPTYTDYGGSGNSGEFLNFHATINPSERENTAINTNYADSNREFENESELETYLLDTSKNSYIYIPKQGSEAFLLSFDLNEPGCYTTNITVDYIFEGKSKQITSENFEFYADYDYKLYDVELEKHGISQPEDINSIDFNYNVSTDNFKDAYRTFLEDNGLKKHISASDYVETINTDMFYLTDLDNDTLPELIVGEDTEYGVYDFIIYTFKDKKINYLYSDYTDTSFDCPLYLVINEYNEKYIVTSGHGTSGYQEFRYISYLNDNLNVDQYVCQEKETFTDGYSPDRFEYFANNKPISSDDFQKIFPLTQTTSKWLKSIEMIKFMKNNEQNRNIYFKHVN